MNEQQVQQKQKVFVVYNDGTFETLIPGVSLLDSEIIHERMGQQIRASKRNVFIAPQQEIITSENGNEKD